MAPPKTLPSSNLDLIRLSVAIQSLSPFTERPQASKAVCWTQGGILTYGPLTTHVELPSYWTTPHLACPCSLAPILAVFGKRTKSREDVFTSLNPARSDDEMLRASHMLYRAVEGQYHSTSSHLSFSSFDSGCKNHQMWRHSA